tara:strand:+ start:41 stop:223 length:183 start_codon:yes stop_codon:yes gene_type:complete
MIKCPACKDLIGQSAPVYKVSRGFIDNEGVFYADAEVVYHQECADSIDPYAILEEDLKNN